MMVPTFWLLGTVYCWACVQHPADPPRSILGPAWSETPGSDAPCWSLLLLLHLEPTGVLSAQTEALHVLPHSRHQEEKQEKMWKENIQWIDDVNLIVWMCGCLYLCVLFFEASTDVIYLQLFLLVLSWQSLLMDLQLLHFLSNMPRKPHSPVLCSPAHLCVSLSVWVKEHKRSNLFKKSKQNFCEFTRLLLETMPLLARLCPPAW